MTAVPGPSRTAAQAGAGPAPPGVLLAALAQLALAAVVVHLYGIENPAFERVFLLAAGGFAVNALLPLRFRLPFFTLLSMAGAFLVFRPADAGWLLGAGALLIGLANLPAPPGVRVAVLLVTGAALALSRAGIVDAPWSAAVWPILGSMFMFRLVLYVMASRTDSPDRRPWWSLAYFFMLPNLVFPLFPVVDYQSFRRTHYDKDAGSIYDLGLLWVARGLVHLVLYRFVYHTLVIEPESVVTLGDLVHFMLATLLLYLRVSGQFHLIVGLLHLFGFRLPETHKLYLLANSFTELWRRINLYWTDFMMKTVFYPTYFRVKDRGPKASLVIATVVVFVVTWLLHSYQWFWLRGGFPLTPQDTLFWAVLGGFVVYGGLRDLEAAKKPRRIGGDQGWNRVRGLQTAATFTMFYALWSLWSIESMNLWLWMLGAAANVDLRGVVLFGGAFVTMLAIGGIDWKHAVPSTGWQGVVFGHTARTVVPLLVLAAAAQPAVQAAMPAPLVRAVRTMQTTGLNARDLTLQHRGYYEQLDVRAQLDTPVAADGRRRDASWQTLDQLGILNDRKDLLLRDLRPSRETLWNGQRFSTNRWGMRDRDYPKEKAAGTLRIAILGPSHVMGNNVADDVVFERLVEERLNGTRALPSYERVEILNFGVDGFSLPQQLALLEDRVFDFAPDVVIATHYKDNADMTEGFLLKVSDQGIAVTEPGLRAVMEDAGLLEPNRGGLPVPYAGLRRLAGSLGVDTRMPFGEARSRARRVVNDVLALSFRRFADLTRARGAVPVVLGLNVVLDEAPATLPLRTVIDECGLPVIDLFGVYDGADLPALRVAPWDDHPNAAGHRLIAEALTRELTTLLTSGVPTPAPLAARP